MEKLFILLSILMVSSCRVEKEPESKDFSNIQEQQSNIITSDFKYKSLDFSCIGVNMNDENITFLCNKVSHEKTNINSTNTN